MVGWTGLVDTGDGGGGGEGPARASGRAQFMFGILSPRRINSPNKHRTKDQPTNHPLPPMQQSPLMVMRVRGADAGGWWCSC